MTSPALDLLLRVVREQLSSETCQACGSSLVDSGLAMRERGAEDVIIEVVCKRCAHVAHLRISPGSHEGIAHVG